MITRESFKEQLNNNQIRLYFLGETAEKRLEVYSITHEELDTFGDKWEFVKMVGSCPRFRQKLGC